MNITRQHCQQAHGAEFRLRPTLGRKFLRQSSAKPLSRKPCYRHIVRARSQQETERQPRPVPAPPVKAPPPPPPPPPDPVEAGGGGPNKRQIVLAFLGFTFISWTQKLGYRSDEPEIEFDNHGRPFFYTPEGVPIRLFKDDTGHVRMEDPAGNEFYDTGDDKLGTYMLQPDGELWNMHLDDNNKEQVARVGNILDLEEIDVQDIAGVPIEEVQERYAKAKDDKGRPLPGKFPDRLAFFPEKSNVELPLEALDFEVTDAEETEDGKNLILKGNPKGPPKLTEYVKK